MTTQITGRWETIIKLIKFENKAKEVLEKHLKDNKLSELPEPEWADYPTRAYIYLPAKSLKGDTFRMDKT